MGLALAGLFVFVLAAVCLSGPGRIDILDGLTRYEVARSLVDHGDSIVRDARVDFLVFRGREGNRYTTYRFPHSVLGAGAIWLADLAGPASEPRRRFFFSCAGAFACAGLAAIYALWFRRQGSSPAAALLWALAGVFCSPLWFYGTTTFDDCLGALAVVLASVVAVLSRRSRPSLGAAIAGLLLGLAFNCKPPLAIFLLAAAAGNADEKLPLALQRARFAWMFFTLSLGIAAYVGYDLYKFPPGETNVAEELARYAPLWPGRPLFGLLGLTISPGAGALWYWPPVVIAICGLLPLVRSEPWFGPWMIASLVIYLAFISTLSFFVGEPAWGPRYLTPAFAALWLFAPRGAARLRRRMVISLLAAGMIVQLAALSVETVRLYIEEQWPQERFLNDRWFYFSPLEAKLVNRPREIFDILADRGPRAERFTPAAEPTFPVAVPRKPIDVRRFHVLNSLRPWWISQQYLSPAERPVDLKAAAACLLALAALGLSAMAAALGQGKIRSWMSEVGEQTRNNSRGVQELQTFRLPSSDLRPALLAQAHDAQEEAGEDRLDAERHEHDGGNDLPHRYAWIQGAETDLTPVPDGQREQR